MSLESFNMNDLLLLVVGISGATATLCLAIQKSKCKNISILYGCLKCDRDTDLILKQEALELGKKLWPLNRSLTGAGVNQTLKILKNYNKKLKIIKFKSGQKVFDWTIPKEWVVNEAWIKDENGKKIINFQNNNLHLVGYSTSIKKKFFLRMLKIL